MMVPWPMLSNHLELVPGDRKFSFMERCPHSDKLRPECVPRHTNPTRWSDRKWDLWSKYLGNLASYISSFWRRSKLIRRLRTPISPTIKRKLFKFAESGVYKLI